MVHHEIGVTVGAAQQMTGTHPLAHHRIAAAVQEQQVCAAGLGTGARGLLRARADPRARSAAAGRRDLGWPKAMGQSVRVKRSAERKPITGWGWGSGQECPAGHPQLAACGFAPLRRIKTQVISRRRFGGIG